MSLDRTRLAKVLALLASDQPGEQAAALHRASAMLRVAGVRWEDLAAQGGGRLSGTTTGASPELLQAMQDMVMRQQDDLKILRGCLHAEERKTDQLRQSNRSLGTLNAALKRRADDLQARLEITTRENAAMRRALGPAKAAQAVHGDHAQETAA